MKNELGMTTIQLMISAVLVVWLGILAIQIVPVYIEYFEVKHVVSSLNDVDSDQYSTEAIENVERIKQQLIKQFAMSVLYRPVDKTIEVTPVEDKKNTYEIHIFYKTTVPLFFNISLLFQFDNKQEVRLGSAQSGN